jgi:hypothetical protein
MCEDHPCVPAYECGCGALTKRIYAREQESRGKGMTEPTICVKCRHCGVQGCQYVCTVTLLAKSHVTGTRHFTSWQRILDWYRTPWM